jgi:natural product biosynthesis luciferase-like monooxygenase protein
VKLSIFFFANDEPPDGGGLYRLVCDAARLADERGFHAVWLPERHFHPFGGIYPNPSVLAAALATVTTRIGLRAGSVVAPLHDPLRVAEEWAVVDNLSGGRVGISFASGWHPRDFVLAPGAYPDRRARTMELLQQVRLLWSGKPVARTDGTGADTEITTSPRPVQAELPTWVTSAGSLDTFVAAGQAGANVLTHLLGQDLGALAEKLALYRAVHATGGDDPWVTLMAHTHLGESAAVVRDRVRGPMTAYLRSSLRLQAGAAGGGTELTEEERDLLVERAFDRYFGQSGMFGTEADALAFVEAAGDAGVDEVACLIDLGTSYEATMDSLERLSALVDRV